MGMMNSIVTLEDQLDFKYMNGSKFSWQTKDKIFAFEMLVDFLRSDVDLVKCMQDGGDIDFFRRIFDHVKCLKD